MRLWVDIESRSRVPIRHGNVKYSTAVEIIMLQYAVDDGPITVIDMMSSETVEKQKLVIFKSAVVRATEIWAHQAEFDRTMLETTNWWKALRIHETKWRCTAALARMHGLPGGLDKLCEIFKLPQDKAKDKRGSELIQLFCIPHDGKYHDKHSHPKQWAEFLSYGAQDVIAMRAV